jgi:hypothetical protein
MTETSDFLGYLEGKRHKIFLGELTIQQPAEKPVDEKTNYDAQYMKNVDTPTHKCAVKSDPKVLYGDHTNLLIDEMKRVNIEKDEAYYPSLFIQAPIPTVPKPPTAVLQDFETGLNQDGRIAFETVSQSLKPRKRADTNFCIIF